VFFGGSFHTQDGFGRCDVDHPLILNGVLNSSGNISAAPWRAVFFADVEVCLRRCEDSLPDLSLPPAGAGPTPTHNEVVRNDLLIGVELPAGSYCPVIPWKRIPAPIEDPESRPSGAISATQPSC
jgi:hypothetical protein